MSIKVTTEDFIKKANSIHNNEYDYSLVKYEKANKKVDIICKIHGVFKQTPNNHTNMSFSRGCSKCRCVKLSLKNHRPIEDFLEKANKIHNFKYDYSLVDYKTAHDNIIIICPIHGKFIQEITNHLSGKGCNKCKIVKVFNLHLSNTKEFVEKAKKLHYNKYNYDLVDYKSCSQKIKIYCNEHKDYFYQTPTNHLNSNGCRICSNNLNIWKKENWIKQAQQRKGTFYIIKCFNENEEFFKFGITFRNVQKRYGKTINKNTMPYNYEIIKEVVSDDLGYIWELEKKFQKFKRNQKYIPKIKFLGCAKECFKN